MCSSFAHIPGDVMKLVLERRMMREDKITKRSFVAMKPVAKTFAVSIANWSFKHRWPHSMYPTAFALESNGR